MAFCPVPQLDLNSADLSPAKTAVSSCNPPTVNLTIILTIVYNMVKR
jgi:hypothetical protein